MKCWMFLSFVVGLFFFSCSSTRAQVKDHLAEKANRVGPINNPNYFGKGGETKEIIVEGRAQILASGEQTAFDSALEHAMRKAVEKVLGTMIDARTIVDDSQLINDHIYARSSGFVQKYQILEERNRDQTKWLTIRAWVVLGDVRNDAQALGIVQDRASRPLILVLIDEKNFDEVDTDFAQKKIEEVLLKKQFEFVDQEQLEKVLLKRRKTVEMLLRDRKDLLKTAVDSGAQVVIRGTVKKKKNDISKNKLLKDKSLKSVTVSLNLSSFTVGDARLLAAKTKTLAGIGLSEDAALQSATIKLADRTAHELIDDFLKKWDDRINEGFEYQVVLVGITFDDVIQIKNQIQRNIEGIKAVFDRGFNGNTQTLLIRYTGAISRLAQALTSRKKLPVSMKLKSYDHKNIFLYR